MQQVRGKLIVEVPDRELAVTLPLVQHIMQDAPFLAVQPRVGARAANNWDEVH